MEDLILKCAEFGILGVIVLLLLTSGLKSLNKLAETTLTLSESQKALTEAIAKLTEKVTGFSYQLEGIERHLEKLEESQSRNFGEIRDLIKSKKE